MLGSMTSCHPGGCRELNMLSSKGKRIKVDICNKKPENATDVHSIHSTWLLLSSFQSHIQQTQTLLLLLKCHQQREARNDKDPN